MSNLTRVGNFSSSEIWKLTTSDRKGTGFGAPALTYIQEKIYERRIGRGLYQDHNAKPTNWGILVEGVCFEKMGFDVKLVSKERYVHPEISQWVGMPDVVSETIVGDIKSPYTLKSFCGLVDALSDIEAFKEYSPEYYFQLVSNAILTGKNKAAIFVYCPYKSELAEIKEASEMFDGDQNKVAFIGFASDNELPYINEGGYYKNLNSLEFEVPQADKDFLTERVKLAVEILNNTK